MVDMIPSLGQLINYELSEAVAAAWGGVFQRVPVPPLLEPASPYRRYYWSGKLTQLSM